MRNGKKITVIIPALDEDLSIGLVLDHIPPWADDIIVADNGSSDSTAAVAAAHNARVVGVPERGYGSACLAGIAAIREADVVVFLDGDFSDHPEEMGLLVDPVAGGNADLVIGSRVTGRREKGSLTIVQRFGNSLACALIRLFWEVRFTDLGPFRAIRYDSLIALEMRDRNYGWTVEMQIAAALAGLKITEIPVSYRKRIGHSKVSGTLRGVLCAGTKILYTIFARALRPRRPK